jgi:hypothetical protein
MSDLEKRERVLAAKVDRLLYDVDDLEQEIADLSDEAINKGIATALEKMATVIQDRELSAGFPLCKRTLAWLFCQMGRPTIEDEL